MTDSIRFYKRTLKGIDAMSATTSRTFPRHTIYTEWESSTSAAMHRKAGEGRSKRGRVASYL
jgi:hypothetical protein